MEVDVAALKRDWAGTEFDVIEFEVQSDDLLEFARACGETEARFIDPGDAGFQAVPNYTSRYVGRRILPERFPKIGDGFGFDAGKSVFCLRPIRPGDTLTATSKVHDIYEKTGRSGPMVFIVHRMEFRNQRGEDVAVVDWRMVQQPEKKRFVKRFEDVDFGEELEPHVPDVSLDTVRQFTRVAKMDFGRFNDHERARKEGLPGAIVPGIMSQGLLGALIHRWAPGSKIHSIDTVFRAPVLVDSQPICRGVVTDLDPEQRRVEIDLTIVNEADETRVMGTAIVELDPES